MLKFEHCEAEFTRMDNLKMHMKKQQILEKAKSNPVSECSIDKEEVEKTLMVQVFRKIYMH